MTAIDPAQCWVPVPTRWRHVNPGDVTVGLDGLLTISHVTHECSCVNVMAYGLEESVDVDPDGLVNVLVPIPERDAARLSLEQLGAQMLGRRTVGGAA